MTRYLFIPSCEVWDRDNIYGPTTERRLKAGLKIWLKGGCDKIIVSGGIYSPPSTQTIAASVLMKQWLVARGVPEDSILCEIKSRDTYENIAFSLALLPQCQNTEIIVISHWQHVLRVWVTFVLAHKINVRLIPLWYWVDWKTFFFECLMLAYHLFDWRGKSYIACKNRSTRTYE